MSGYCPHSQTVWASGRPAAAAAGSAARSSGPLALALASVPQSKTCLESSDTFRVGGKRKTRLDARGELVRFGRPSYSLFDPTYRAWTFTFSVARLVRLWLDIYFSLQPHLPRPLWRGCLSGVCPTMAGGIKVWKLQPDG